MLIQILPFSEYFGLFFYSLSFLPIPPTQKKIVKNSNGSKMPKGKVKKPILDLSYII